MAIKTKEYKIQKEIDYMHHMVEAIKSRPQAEKKPATTTQCASTQAILDRDPSKDAEHFNRPILNWKAVPNAKNLDEAVAARQFDATQVAVVEDIRRKGRNTLGDAISQGISGSTQETKVKAVEAFTYSMPAPLTPEQEAKAVELNRIQYYGEIDNKPVVVKPKTSLASKLLHWLWKNDVPIYKLTNKELSVQTVEEMEKENNE